MSDTVEIKLCEWYDEHWYKIIVQDKLGNEELNYYPSTTTKLSALAKDGLLKWYGDIGTSEAKKRTKAAGDRGSRIHNALEVYAKGGAVVYNPNIKNSTTPANYSNEEIEELAKKYKGNIAIIKDQDEQLQVYKIQQLFRIIKPNILGIETVVYSNKNKEAGTVDLICHIKGGNYEGIDGRKKIDLEEGIYICDYKSGSLYDDAYMQMASYREMFIEMYPDKKDQIKGALIFHLGSTTKTGIPGLAVVHRTNEQLDKDYDDFRHTAAMWERKHKNAMPRLLEFPSIIAMGM